MNILTKWLRSYLPTLPTLSVSDDQLAEDLTLRGIAVEGIFDSPIGGKLFEMDLTTNRVDAMNHYGVAREVAAIYNIPLHTLEQIAGVPHSSTASSSMGGETGFPVRIEADDLCGRFTARIIRGVTIKPATGQLAEYFTAIGQKPISNAVDVTNFGWLAMGQPTHVFDLDTLEGGIVVRRAHAGEYLKLLDGTDRTLTPDDLVIADEKKALGLAGVMGGWDSRVTDATKNILVEAAWFDPAAIRASSRRHGLHTDASHRFERGADFDAAPLANNLVTRMVVEQCGGEAIGPLTNELVETIAAKTANRKPILLHVSEVNRHLGSTIDGTGINTEMVRRFLSALGCLISVVGEPDASGEFAQLPIWSVQLPSWRLDLEREIDLIEEVARVYGYNRFANTLPAFAGEVHELPHAAQEAAIRATLRALGFTDGLSSSFVSAEEAATFGDAKSGAVPMGNPLSEEAGMLRPSLASGMAAMLADNVRRDTRTVRLYELGTAFTGSTATVHEATRLSLGLTGSAAASQLHHADDALFFEAKGALEALLQKFTGTLTFTAAPLPSWIEPSRGAQALLDGKSIAVFGELSATELAKRKLRQTAIVAELDAQTLFATPLRQPIAQDVSRFQAVERDFSFLFPDTIQWQAIEAAVRALNLAELQSLTPLEIFRDPKGKAVATGSYSLLLRTVFQSPDRTLTEEDIAAAVEPITTALTALGGTQRA
jgi:phenylalanyl-tRNA synthetase beta chain